MICLFLGNRNLPKLIIKSIKEKNKFISKVDLNKSSKACSPCSLECKKINDRVNNRKLSEINTKEVPHILKVFNFLIF